MIYPAWRHHKELGSKLIKSAAEESDGWYDSPLKWPKDDVVEQKEEIKSEEIKEEVKLTGNEIIDDLKIPEKKKGRKPKA